MKIISKIIISILLGLILAIYIIQQKISLKEIAYQKTKFLFDNNLNCSSSFIIDKINLFNGTIKLKNLSIKPKNKFDQSWSWNCQKLSINFSWFNLLINRKISTKITINHLNLNSLYQKQKLAISDHLYQLLLAPSPMPIELTNLEIKNGLLNLDQPDLNLVSQINWSSNSKTILNTLKSQIYLKNGNLSYCQNNYLNHLTGNLQINLPFDSPTELTANCELSFKNQIFNTDDQLFLNAKWNKNTGTCKLKSIQGKTELNLLANNLQSNFNLTGNCVIKNLVFDNHSLLDQAEFIFNYNNLWHGQFNLNKNNFFNILGSWKWQKPDQIDLKGEFNYFFQDKSILKNNYETVFNPKYLQLTRLEISHENQTKPYLYTKSKKAGHLTTILDLELIHSYLPTNIQALICGNGKLEIDAKLNQSILNCELKLSNSNLILPKIYNIIKDANGTISYDFKNQILIINNLNILLHHGEINILQALIKNNYIYLPIFFHNLALNFERNLITSCCGKVLYQNYINQKEFLKGFVLLEQTLCKYNPLSNDLLTFFGSNKLNNSKSNHNLILDLNLLTYAPIKIKSEFLETNASANLKIAGPLINPKVAGQVKIYTGKINFPYKPLYIRRGYIYLTGYQPDQITIDLIAKNNLKNHEVTMHLNGPISNPQINLESSPFLTSEQIGALLLLGTNNTTLNIMMPAIIMQNLNNIVFGSIYDEEKTNSLVKKIFRPLDHVKFVPSFSDETGRGGLKGAVEINVNDRLNALIQKNFSLTEDVKLEIDYAISDDVSIRAISDERGDLGGELEIRFKI